MKPIRLVVAALITACGHDGGPSQGDETMGSSPSTTVSDSITESGDASATNGTTLATDSADSTAGEETGEPPPPDCGGIGPAVDDLGTTPGESSLPSPT